MAESGGTSMADEDVAAIEGFGSPGTVVSEAFNEVVSASDEAVVCL